MKKVLFLIPTLSGGGAENVLVNLCNELSGLNYDVHIRTLIGGGINEKRLCEKITYSTFFRRKIKGLRFFMKFFPPKLLYKFFIREDYDIVCSYLEGPTTRILSGCNKKNIKKIAWIHVEVTNKQFFNAYLTGVNGAKRTYKKFNKVCFVSEDCRKSFCDYIPFNNNMIIVHNVINSKEILSKSLESNPINNFDNLNIVMIGRLTEQKGYYRALEAIKCLENKKVIFNLYIIGDGPEYKGINDYIKFNKLTNVFMVEYTTNPYIYLRNCDILLCSSFREGYSTVVCESLILEVPVLTTDCSGMKEILENDKYGLIVPNSFEGIVNGLEKINNNKELILQYKEKIKEECHKFSIESLLKENIDVLFGDYEL